MAAASYPELARASFVLTTTFGVALVAIVGLVVIHREALRRLLLRAVDPRPLGLLRVMFGLCLLLGALEVAPLNEYLFSDEGLLPSAAVPQVYGKAALAGYGDGVRAPAGFDGGASLLQYVTSGRWSLLYFWDSPTFVRGYFFAFVLACAAMVVGWRTRVSTAVTWLLYVGMLRRGDAHWGGEQVYCGFLVLLVLARAGEAFSVDNWWRCRRLRARGLLSEPGGPGDGAGAPPGPEHPQGLAAIYRRVPAWPQVLIAGQLAICYAANGWAKSGVMWASGDSLAAVLHLDRHARFDFHGVVLMVGEWPLRLATWGVLWWERLFPLVLVGLWISAAGRSGAPMLRGAARGASRGCWLILAAALAVAATVPEGLGAGDGDVAGGARAGVFAAVAIVIVLATSMAGRTVRVRGRTIDRGWFAAWPLGPWLWLGFGAVFHAINLMTLNVGMFALATLTTYVVCGWGEAAVAGVQRVGRALARWGVAVPKHLSRETAIAAEDPSLPHLWRDEVVLPGWALASAGALVLAGGLIAVQRGELAWWHGAWLTAAVVLIMVGRRAAERSGELAELREPWAYGPAGRTAAGGLVAYHLVALLLWQAPPWPALAWRDAARGLLEPWMELTFTRQAWAMFSPNAASSNVSLRTTVIDAGGVEHDLRTELEHPENLVRPYVWHDRWRKVDEVILTGRKWLAPWHARYVCRRWALGHGGEVAREVVLARVKAPISVWAREDPLALFWARAQVESVVRVACATEPFAQLDGEVLARHGMVSTVKQHHSWPAKPDLPRPWTPLWWVLALGLGGGVMVWSRADRRRRVARATARRTGVGDA